MYEMYACIMHLANELVGNTSRSGRGNGSDENWIVSATLVITTLFVISTLFAVRSLSGVVVGIPLNDRKVGGSRPALNIIGNQGRTLGL